MRACHRLGLAPRVSVQELDHWIWHFSLIVPLVRFGHSLLCSSIRSHAFRRLALRPGHTCLLGLLIRLGGCPLLALDKVGGSGLPPESFLGLLLGVGSGVPCLLYPLSGVSPCSGFGWVNPLMVARVALFPSVHTAGGSPMPLAPSHGVDSSLCSDPFGLCAHEASTSPVADHFLVAIWAWPWGNTDFSWGHVNAT